MYGDLSSLARKLGRYIAKQSTNGLPKQSVDISLEEFPTEGPKSIGLALAELKVEGLVTLTHGIGSSLPVEVCPTVELFITFDPEITGYDPTKDSVDLARMLIDKPQLGRRTSELEKASGWDRRRFNPAFALVVSNVAEGRVRKPIQNEYPAIGMQIENEDIVRLHRYIQQNSR